MVFVTVLIYYSFTVAEFSCRLKSRKIGNAKQAVGGALDSSKGPLSALCDVFPFSLSRENAGIVLKSLLVAHFYCTYVKADRGAFQFLQPKKLNKNLLVKVFSVIIILNQEDVLQ